MSSGVGRTGIRRGSISGFDGDHSHEVATSRQCICPIASPLLWGMAWCWRSSLSFGALCRRHLWSDTMFYHTIGKHGKGRSSAIKSVHLYDPDTQDYSPEPCLNTIHTDCPTLIFFWTAWESLILDATLESILFRIEVIASILVDISASQSEDWSTCWSSMGRTVCWLYIIGNGVIFVDTWRDVRYAKSTVGRHWTQLLRSLRDFTIESLMVLFWRSMRPLAWGW